MCLYDTVDVLFYINILAKYTLFDGSIRYTKTDVGCVLALGNQNLAYLLSF